MHHTILHPKGAKCAIIKVAISNMKNVLKRILIVVSLLLTAGLGVVSPMAVYADSVCDNSGVPERVKAAHGCGSTGTDDQLVTTVQTIVKRIIAVLGVVCVIVVVIGGITYMTSAGDTQKIEKGKKTIIYGLVGLVICALAFAIVNFMIVNVIGGK